VTAPFGATYRLQLHGAFDLAAATEVVPYLRDLGVTHVYTSPLLRAAPGSTHGYDVVDHDAIDEQLGGAAAMETFVAALREHGLGLVVDVVPNHMATHHTNPRWRDVLRSGRASSSTAWFDLEWGHGTELVPDRLLLPLLGDHYGEVLTSGDLRLGRGADGLVLTYFEHELPLSASSTLELLRDLAAPSAGAAQALLDLRRADDAGDGPAVLEAMRALATCWTADDELAGAVDRVLDEATRAPERLHDVLERQHYRLARWQMGPRELDYRRFFDITGLIGLRVEDPDVFTASHAVLLRGVAEGWIQGLRIDHPDGLADPTGYLDRLGAAAPGAWILVEKILIEDEQLPARWTCDGTTGYESTIAIGGLFVDAAAEEHLTETFHAYTGEGATFDEIRREAKRTVAELLLPGEVARVTAALAEHAAHGPGRVDVAPDELRPAVTAYLVEFPVYRTYLRAGEPPDEQDVQVVRRARESVEAQHPDLDPALVDLVERALLGAHEEPSAADFVTRFQQLTGPVMAKGVEDTALYRDTRLVALNEVGGDPLRFGTDLRSFHAAQVRAQASHPRRMVTTTTHDTKRTEDVRARIAVLSEVPELWRSACERWAARCAAIAGRLGVERDPVVEVLLHQTLIGAHPLPADRAHDYLTKAAREAKRTTSWLAPDEAAESALHAVLEGLLDDPDHRRELDELVGAIAPAARVASLAQKLVALTVPGVPDLYQGSELWTDGLVDPDNRRPVDYDLRRSLLDAPASTRWADVGADVTGVTKLAAVRATLALRRRRHAAFVGEDASYEPLVAEGEEAHRVVAFARGGAALTVVPRLAHGLAAGGGWGATELVLPEGEHLDVLSGERVAGGRRAMSDLLGERCALVLELGAAGEVVR